jgi:RNA polymerase sigma factor (sigma-70 family)
MAQETSDILDLIRACFTGDGEARRRFQEEYGEDIYNFPVKIYGAPLEEAGDFYLYVFEKDRIFTRIRTFEGRNSIQFRTFLSYYVLKHLFLEWQRSSKELETVSLQTPVGSSVEGERALLEDVLPDSATLETAEIGSPEEESATEAWRALDPQERLDLKLLSLLECDLGPEDVRLLARISGRSIADTLALLAEVQEGLKRKDEKLSQLRDELDAVWGWILLRQKELQEIDEKIHLLTARGDTEAKLLAQKKALEQTLAKRYRQKERLTEEIRTYKMTTPYKDIARLLNLTVGTVCSRIFRLRERLIREFGERWALEEDIV